MRMHSQQHIKINVFVYLSYVLSVKSEGSQNLKQ